MKRKASSEQDLSVERDRREDPSTFYKKYLWKQISRNGEEESGRILRTIYCQFGKWCAKKRYMVQDTDNLTKLWWFKRIVPYLCYEDPCVKVLRGHTNIVFSVIKLNETTVVSASSDHTLRVWDLPNDTSRVLREHTGVVRNYPAEVERSLHFKSAAGEGQGVSIGRKNGLCVGRQGRVRERQILLQIQRGSGQFELGSC